MEIKEEIKKKKKDGWIEVILNIEAMAGNEETVIESLKNHIEKLSKAKDTFVFEKEFSDIVKVEKPIKNVDVAYSQISTIKLLSKNLFSLIAIIMMYGPSSVEIISPNSKEVKIDEIQNISNTVAGVMHQFAAAGIGGILISSKDKKSAENNQQK